MDPRRPVSVAAALPVATLGAEARSGFLIRTYLHLYAAIVAFTLIEAFLFVTGLATLYLIDSVALLATLWAVWKLPSVPPTGETKKAGLRAVAERTRDLEIVQAMRQVLNTKKK